MLVTEPSDDDVPWVGAAVPRVEDRALLTGEALFVDDVSTQDALIARFVRGDIAGAGLGSIDDSQALSVAGVVAVLTDDDLDARPLRAVLDRPEFVTTDQPLLARDVIRYVGEPAAMVLAEDAYSAEDGAETVVLELGAPRPVLTLDEALEGAGPIHAAAPDNVLLDVVLCEDDGINDVLGAAAEVVTGTFDSGRVTAAPMEPRGVVATWDRRNDRLVVWTSTQVPHLVRTCIAAALTIAEDHVRVIAPDVGGGFGQKCAVAREEVAVAVAAYRRKGTVRWVEDRQENLVTAFQGHQQRYTIRAGFDQDGMLLGIDLDILCDVGAYSCFPFSCGVEPLMAAGEFPNAYKLPRYRVRTRGVATTKAPMAPYRGVSRPQICWVLERVYDIAAGRLGLDRAEIRRRNIIRREEFPYQGITGITYDEGSYLEALEAALDRVGYDQWAQRKAQARTNGRRLGLGFSCFNERTGYGTPTFAARGMIVTPGYETARMTMDPSGKVQVALGSSAHGQGHRTTLSQVVADQLALHPRDVRVIQGDTDATPYGWGTFASRGAVASGGAAHLAARHLADKIRRIAAHLIEASPDDIIMEGAMASVKGSPDVRLPLSEIARIAHHERHLLPPHEDARLEVHAEFDPPGTFSNAAHVALVEIDPGTGAVGILDYVVAEDCGVVINPTIVDGQVRGGVAQGIAAALYEEVTYEPDSGQCTTSTFIDYLVPTAGEIPPIQIIHLQTPSAHSHTGAKGMGEGGTIGAPAAIANAVADAVADDPTLDDPAATAVLFDHLPIRPPAVLAALAANDKIGSEAAT